MGVRHGSGSCFGAVKDLAAKALKHCELEFSRFLLQKKTNNGPGQFSCLPSQIGNFES